MRLLVDVADFGPVRVVRNRVTGCVCASAPGPEHMPVIVWSPGGDLGHAILTCVERCVDRWTAVRGAPPDDLLHRLEEVVRFPLEELTENAVRRADGTQDPGYTHDIQGEEMVWLRNA